jgi:hypothetical protein
MNVGLYAWKEHPLHTCDVTWMNCIHPNETLYRDIL